MLETKNFEPLPSGSRNTEDIIGNTPRWLLKSGISMLGLVVVAIITLAAFIKFPDKTSSTGIMTSETPPIEHKSVSGGIVDTIFAQHNAAILEGEPILLIKNPCEVDDISAIGQFISDYEDIRQVSEYLKLKFPTNLRLGDLQPEYANLQFLFMGLSKKLQDLNTQEQINIIKKEIAHIDQLNTVLSKQKEFSREELSLVEKSHSRNRMLKRDSVISDLDLEKSTLELVGYQKSLENFENTLIENNMRKEQLRLRIYQLKEEKSNFVNDYTLKIQETGSKLKQGIKEWKENYYVTAEISGTVLFASSITEKVRLAPNQLIANILPSNTASQNFVRAFTVGKGIGKVDIDNKVILKIDGYPYREFGVVTSYISAISLLPEEDNNGNLIYELIIPLPNTIKTNYNTEIPYSPNTGVIAEVITEDMSVLQRIFNEFLNLLKNT